MKKLLFVFFLIFAIFSSIFPSRVLSIDSNDDIKLILNGKTFKSDVEPRIVNEVQLYTLGQYLKR